MTEQNGTARPAPGVKLVDWKAMERNTLRGFATVKLPNGLTIHDVLVHATNGKAWASLPSKPIVGSYGVAHRDQGTGKLKYVPILEWPDRDTSDRFSTVVVEAVEAQYPGAVRR